ncbi:MAG: DUF4435 domain-containing protein [Cyanobacteria bacterium P01_F01_bin.143]
MRKFITVEREANAIKLQRSSFFGTFLLVEGISDKKLYQNLIDEEKCKLVVVSGKPSSKIRAIKIIEILDKSNFQGILAIVDADFDHLEQSSPQSPNLLLTDTHDLETMLLQSPALDKVIREFGSEDKINQLNQDRREVLLELGLSIGYLRWISQSENLNLTFNGIKFTKFIDQKTLEIDELKLIKVANNKSLYTELEILLIHEKLISKKSPNHDPWQVCCGHDLVEILSIGLRKEWGTNNATDIKAEKLEIILRIGYEEVYFFETKLYINICTWENRNSPFNVLRNRR